MRLKDFSTLIVTLVTTICFSQYDIKGRIIAIEKQIPLTSVEIVNVSNNSVTRSDEKGAFLFSKVKPGQYRLVFLSDEYRLQEEIVTVVNQDVNLLIALHPMEIKLSEILIKKRKKEIFAMARLRDVEETAIYAGKKTEVVIMDNMMGNRAVNVPRQVFSQVVGLNIYESDNSGLQLNIGGRGLDPNRSAHFNIRQNDYDISADILGYPESYYTPATEGLDRIEVIRGAASLQYGTQFGGLINFKMKSPDTNKICSVLNRQTIGSNNLFTSFTSLSGTIGKFSYYTFFNYKLGDGFQPNSEFESKNYFGNFRYRFTTKTSLCFEYTHFQYLAQQPGGLTDKMFYENAFQSNRKRNWFAVDWNLFSLKLKHAVTSKTDLSVNLFGLYAGRKALGFRSNRVFQEDHEGTVRDLITGKFANWGAETRILKRYGFFKNENAFVAGFKYYQSDNTARQGPGSSGRDANFDCATAEFPYYQNQSDYNYPNRNLALFGENIFRITDKFAITPGIRFEHITTQAKGFYRKINRDNAGNVIFDETLEEHNKLNRSFVLLGIGFSYKPIKAVESYMNFSQNYRSVTFNDIRISEPSYKIDENLKDEKGYTFDFGIRGQLKNKLTYDISAFGLAYKGRLGQIIKETEDFRIIRFRTNVGDAFIYGMEIFADLSLQKTLFSPMNPHFKWNAFINLALTKSEYIRSKQPGIQGNKVEFVPMQNLKSGMLFGYKNLMTSMQFTYMSDQYTDATNSKQDKNENIKGIEGQVPTYYVVDWALSLTVAKKITIETGINNLTNTIYFTRRATGYPGPGIIPSAPRSYYATLQLRF
ncbi:TonB-dependent receptor [Flavobacterium sp.]|uniref:TonB-dependent receptor n=1 Tax=Flavobacterium sp. TaxID=239 RepID=UPI002638A862|nr:TonB-dependent receptor [Flavobacterium sp.]